MPAHYFESRDAKTANLHIVMSVIEHKLAELGANDAETVAELKAFLGELVTLLALPPNHEVRDCPVCNHVVMRAAKRCGNCWSKLVPMSPVTTTVSKPDTSPVESGSIVLGSD